MILIDANILVYSYVEEMPQHEASRTWLDARLSGRQAVGLPWESLLAFVRLVSDRRLFPKPAPLSDAWSVVEGWLAAPPSWIPQPTDRHFDVLGELLPAVSRASLLPDAHLAALAIEHGLALASADGDFARFDALRWINPLDG